MMTTNQPILMASTPPRLPTAEFSATVRPPGALYCKDGVIFAGLERAVKMHLFNNAHRHNENPRPARFLNIQGRPGTGKSVTAADAASRQNYATLLLNASSVASENEGGAVDKLESTLGDAERYSSIHKHRIVIIADDFDLGIITADENTGKTINSNLVTQRLQALADTSEYRDHLGAPIPLIFTSNDFTHVRSSLFRDGRSRWFTHEPTLDEKIEVAVGLFKPRGLRERAHIEKLVRRYRNESIAFWAALRSDLINDHVDEVFDTDITNPALVLAELRKHHPLDPRKLRALAKKHAKARVRRSFL